MRNIDEIRDSIKDLIEKAEKSVDETSLDLVETKDPSKNNNKNLLPENVLSQIKEEVMEFQNAFEDHEVKNAIAQSIRDTMRPILDEWLKNNLPNIVRQVVEEKIEKIRKQS